MKRLAITGLAALLALPAAAQDESYPFDVGRAEYMTACAACHGENADGNGPIASMFSQRVPGLKGLSAANDGMFPLHQVVQIIDGRADVRAHGAPMPVFGARYSRDLGMETETPLGNALVRARILELAAYLQSIQE